MGDRTRDYRSSNKKAFEGDVEAPFAPSFVSYKTSRSSTKHMTEMTCQMTLVRKACRVRDFVYRQLRLC